MAELLEDVVLDASAGVHRPRNLDWKRAAALLYGDWGTSKAYVIGLAFLAAGFSSFPIILAVCALTGLVGINYVVICRHFPDGGGVYSAARSQGRLLAVVGALLLLADLTVTASSRPRSEEHTSELQSPDTISYAVFCLKKKNKDDINWIYVAPLTRIKKKKR